MDSPSTTTSMENDIVLLSPTSSPINDFLLDQRVGESEQGLVIENYGENNNDDQNSLCSEGSVSSNEFFGRDINDYLPDEEDEGEWIQYLSEVDRLQLLRGETKINPEDWTDRLISDVGEDCELLLDSSKKEAMESCLLEVKHIDQRLKTLLRKNLDNNVSIEEIVELALGSKSEFCIAISEALELNRL